MIRFIQAITLLFYSAIAFSSPRDITSFPEAKRLLKGIWADHRTEVYCGCSFDSQMRVTGACGLPAPLTRRGEPNTRARKVEFEHM